MSSSSIKITPRVYLKKRTMVKITKVFSLPGKGGTIPGYVDYGRLENDLLLGKGISFEKDNSLQTCYGKMEATQITKTKGNDFIIQTETGVYFLQVI